MAAKKDKKVNRFNDNGIQFMTITPPEEDDVKKKDESEETEEEDAT